MNAERAGRLKAIFVMLALAFSGRAHAQTDSEMPGTHDMMKWGTTGFVLSEVLEYVPLATARPVAYDLVGWFGGTTNRLWAKADGSQNTGDSAGGTELQLLYGRLISPFWDAQIGLRVDALYGDQPAKARAALALGLQGLAPGWFELEPTVFVSHRGDVFANLTTSYDLLVTQRLIAQPRLEARAAVQEVPEFGVGSGVNDFELALRVRYEIWREFAPYLGVSWERRFGETATLAGASGEEASEVSVVLGLRVWR